MMSEPADEAPSSVPNAPLAPPPARAETPAADFEKRLEEIVSTIQEFAALRFSARAPVGSAGDIVDAVAAGVNFLGEELDASFSEIERRVADRTEDLSIAMKESGQRALHDQLTGLPNRVLFWEHLSLRVKLARRRKTRFAVLFLDVDDFKVINDTLGHAAGDQLLVDLALRLHSALRVGDIAARVGGDEFLLLFDEVASREAALVVAERLNRALRAPYSIGTERRIVTASLGVAVGPDGLHTADAVVAAADSAMYEAKRCGGGRCVLYSADAQESLDRPAAGETLD
jgi:diguanylate cyclase (GGDEF)-like protein